VVDDGTYVVDPEADVPERWGPLRSNDSLSIAGSQDTAACVESGGDGKMDARWRGLSGVC
jgi:hypothetical protein